jgi:hypothetical protein
MPASCPSGLCSSVGEARGSDLESGRVEIESGVLLSVLGWLREKKYPAVATRLPTPGQPIS